eukprot:5475763-Pyramimonas_sp.AAC.1
MSHKDALMLFMLHSATLSIISWIDAGSSSTSAILRPFSGILRREASTLFGIHSATRLRISNAPPVR